MLTDFSITERWPPAAPDRIQLYSLATPNGVKVSILPEETGLPWEAHRITLDQDGVLSPALLSLNHNNNIRAAIDPDGPDILPWVRVLSGYYEAAELVGTDAHPNLQRALARFVARPAVISGLVTPAVSSASPTITQR